MPAPGQSQPARSRYLIADFTLEEKTRVLRHCLKKHISISRFLAEVAMEDVRAGSKAGHAEEKVTITMKIGREHNIKLQMFAHRQNKTPDQFCRDLLLPTLQKARTSFSAKTEGLRYYLSPQEHRLLKSYLRSRKLSSRSYVAFLAMQKLDQENKK